MALFGPHLDAGLGVLEPRFGYTHDVRPGLQGHLHGAQPNPLAVHVDAGVGGGGAHRYESHPENLFGLQIHEDPTTPSLHRLAKRAVVDQIEDDFVTTLIQIPDGHRGGAPFLTVHEHPGALGARLHGELREILLLAPVSGGRTEHLLLGVERLSGE